MNHHVTNTLLGLGLTLVVLSGSLWAQAAAAGDTPAAKPLTVAHATDLKTAPTLAPSTLVLARIARELRLEARENLRAQLSGNLDSALDEALVIAD